MSVRGRRLVGAVGLIVAIVGASGRGEAHGTISTGGDAAGLGAGAGPHVASVHAAAPIGDGHISARHQRAAQNARAEAGGSTVAKRAWRRLWPLGLGLARQVLGAGPEAGAAALPTPLVTSSLGALSCLGLDLKAAYRGANAMWLPYRRIVLSRYDRMASTELIFAPSEGEEAPCARGDFSRELRASMQSPDPAARQAFYDGPWAAAAAQLPQEAACMQLWAHTAAYMFHAPGTVVPLGIQRLAEVDRPPTWSDGTPVAYAARNVVRHAYPGVSLTALLDAEPLSAFVTWPEDDGPGPAIIVFRGTQPGRADVLAELADSGLGADADHLGVGHSAFARHAPLLRGWVEEAHAAGRGVVILGHSLGATLATRLMADLTPDAQARTRLLAMAPAGVEREVAARIVPGRDNVVNVFDRRDIVPTVGQRLAPGTCLEAGFEGAPAELDAQALIEAHVAPFLAASLLGWSATPTRVRLWSAREISVDPLGLGEAVRSTLLLSLVSMVEARRQHPGAEPLAPGEPVATSLTPR